MNQLDAEVDAAGWDLVIRPKTSWLELDIAELWRYRDLIHIFVWRDFVATYKQTILGPLWFLIQPMLTTMMFTLVFGKIAGITTGGVPAVLFYLCGISAWGYFAECLNRTSGTFIANAGIFGKVYFPRLCVPISLVISGLIKFGIQLALFLVFWLIYWMRGAAVGMTWAIVLVPVLLLLMAVLGLGAGIIVSALTTKYRDLQHLVGFGVQLLMFATPIIYPLSSVPAKYRWLIELNPMSPVIEVFRYAFLGSGSFDGWLLLQSAGLSGLVFLTGVLLFNHVERTFMDTV